MTETTEESEEILNSALQTLYDYQPITLTSAGSLFTYVSTPSNGSPLTITLRTPDTHPSNWSLHASSIWSASRHLVDHLNYLHLDSHLAHGHQFRLLEFGAGAGLPGIFIAKTYPDVLVTVSDYPDEELIRTLSENVERNQVSANCQARAYAWGTDPSPLTKRVPTQNQNAGNDSEVHLFDVVIAADTLWNPDLHALLIDSLTMVLKKSYDSRAHLVAGLHTGRYTLQSFFDSVTHAGLVVESIEERETNGEIHREWDVTRAEGEDEKERRRWVLWIVLKWSKASLI